MVFCICGSLAACGGSGGGSSLPSPIPSGTVKGVAHDNVLIGSKITVYQYSGGTKGASLGTATTNNDGNYSLSVQCETTSLLLEATGGYYMEEASRAQVNLKAGQVLRAVVNFKTRDTISTQLTPFTHMAAGLAEYRIKHGTSAGAAVESANQDISEMLGFDIIKTKPVDVTNPLNATVFVSNEHRYGFLSAAISGWTMYASSKVEPDSIHANFNSIAFAQLVYRDISSDGVLDGKGLDNTNQLEPLSFGLLPLNANVYRHGLAAHLIQFADKSENNHTNLKGAALQSFASAYAAYSGAIYGNVAPLDFSTAGSPVITGLTISNSTGDLELKSGSLIGQKRSVCGSIFAVGEVETAALLFFSSNPSPVNLKPFEPCWELDATDAPDGSQVLTLNVVDTYGISTTLLFDVTVDNTPPHLTVNSTSVYSWPALMTSLTVDGSFSDSCTGVSSIELVSPKKVLAFGEPLSGSWSLSHSLANLWLDYGFKPMYKNLVIRDNADNCSTYRYSFTCTGYRSDAYTCVSGNISAQTLVSSGSCL